MDIVFISPECYPFTLVTDLSEIVSGLAKGIEKEGNNVKVIIPRYGSIDPVTCFIERLPKEFHFDLKGETTSEIVYKGIIPESLASVFLIDNQSFFSNSREVYLKNIVEDKKRFDFFCHGALNLISVFGVVPDVIHFFGFHVAGGIKVLKAQGRHNNFNKSAVFFTFSSISRDEINQLSEAKEAIKLTDFVTSTSKGFVNEILSRQVILQDLGEILIAKGNRFLGINSGLDYFQYDPEKEVVLGQNYSKTYFSIGKKKCKEELLMLAELDVDIHLPIFSVLPELIVDSGAELLTSSIHKILSSNLCLLFVCDGLDKHSFNQFFEIEKRYKNFKLIELSDHDQIKKIFAGSDFVISTNKSDPTGITILKSMRYGAVPIAYLGGAVKDIVLDFQKEVDGNGIVFESYTPDALVEAVNKALSIYKNREMWPKIVKSAMNCDLSNEITAKEYIKYYQDAIKLATTANFYQ